MTCLNIDESLKGTYDKLKEVWEMIPVTDKCIIKKETPIMRIYLEKDYRLKAYRKNKKLTMTGTYIVSFILLRFQQYQLYHNPRGCINHEW